MRNKKNFNEIKKMLEKQKYAVVGHSGVQVCQWTKNSLNNQGVCWKEKFYGIKSHRCCQFSPAVMFCENMCLHCWRPIEYNLGLDISKYAKVEEPKEILDKIIAARKKLLIGAKGNPKTSRKKVQEAFEPTLFTLSLSGEATLYPKLAEMLREIRRRKAISFLVTNGQNPEKLKELEEKHALPTQLVISTNAPNEELFNAWHRSLKKDAWKKFNETLELVKKLKGKTRRVVRLTLVREDSKKLSSKEFIDNLSNMKDEHVKEYATLIRKAQPDFIHVKGYKAIGASRARLCYWKMPFHKEVKEFAKKLAGELKSEGYKILCEEERSSVVILGKNKKDMRIRKEQI